MTARAERSTVRKSTPPSWRGIVLACIFVALIPAESAAEMKRDRLTVLNYNIWHGLNPTSALRFDEFETRERREARLAGFLEQARALDPDIIFLQEVNPAPDRSKGIARALGYDRVFLVDNAGIKIGSLGLPTNLRSGLAILAKKDLGLKKLGGRKLSGSLGSCSRFFSFQYNEFRYLLAAAVTVQGRRVLLLNTHLHHGLEVTPEIEQALDDLVAGGQVTRERADEVIAVTNRASERRSGELARAVAFAEGLGLGNTPALFAGDFNATPGAPELTRLIDTVGFQSVTCDDDPDGLLLTWDTKRNPNTGFVAGFKPVNEFESFIMDHLKPVVLGQSRRLDYIFHHGLEGFMEVGEAALFGDEPAGEILCSDHFGLYAVFGLVE